MLLATLALAGCSSETFDVLIDVRTDFAPGSEFDRVTVRLIRETGPAGEAVRATETSARTGQDYFAGQRAAEFGALSADTYGLEIDLLRGSESVATRTVVVRVGSDVGLVVVLTRACLGIVCPTSGAPIATSCVGGVCVDPRCVEAGDPACPGVAECAGNGDCSAGAATCAMIACAEGFCLEGTPGSACGAAESCDPAFGCVPDSDVGPPMDTGPPDAPGSWLDGWARRKPIDFAASQVPSDQNDFPVYVGIVSDAELAAVADEPSLIFTGADGVTVLPFEIERFDTASGRLDAWVRLQTLSSSADTRVYLYYDTAMAPAPPDPSGVWDDDHVGVWHLAELPTVDPVIVDSTGAVDLTPMGGMPVSARQDGQLGWAIDFDGMDDRLTAMPNPRLAASSAITISAWVRVRTWQPDSGTIAARSTMEGSSNHDYHLRAGEFDLNFGAHTGTPNGVTSGTWGGTTGEWRFVAGTYDGVTQALWLDGALTTSNSVSGTIRDTDRPFHIGSWGVPDMTRTWDGWIDEVRVSTIARSPEWLATRFANESDPTSFHTVGPEERAAP